MHFSIIVAGDNYEEQLAPFQENNMEDCPKEYLEFYVDGEYYETKEEAERAVGKRKCEEDGYWTNPNSHWDWYVLGGRYQRKFLPKDGVEYDVGSASVFEAPDPRFAARIRKGDIDFDRMKKEWTDRRINEWNELMKALDGREINWKPSTDFDWENADEREKFWNQDGVSQIKDAEDFKWGFSRLQLDMMLGCKNVDDWIKKHDWRGCYRPYGYIKDGEWIDADWDKNETFAKDFDEWFDNLPDDTIINVVDCHE